jgi:hypothetical protein
LIQKRTISAEPQGPKATNMPRAHDTDPVIDAYKRDVDRTLIRENLKLSVEERLKKLTALQQFAFELRRAGQAARAKK